MTKITGNIEHVFTQLALLAALCSFLGVAKSQSAEGNVAKNKQIADVQVKNGSEQKNEALFLQAKDFQLLKKQTQIVVDEAEKSRTLRNFSIALSLMLLIILGLGYNQYRLKRRSNLLQESNQKTISAKNTHMEKLLRENEWLIKEVHHRVKNNMQLVISLLTSQCDTLTDPSAIQAITESLHRIQAMALIHQKLYTTDYSASVYMPDYVNELIDYLRESFEKGRLIFFDVDIAGIRLALHQAIPVGLILNETITNAIRYAFPQQLDCVIKIRFLVFNEVETMLMVSDNGAGFNYEQIKRGSFGLLLLKGLTEELGGTFTLESNGGTTITSVFKQNIGFRRISKDRIKVEE
jgi:two-component sensor histidine kinase